MYLCTDHNPRIELPQVKGFESARAYRALFSLDVHLRALTEKHSARAEKARIATDMHIMSLRCSEALPEVFRNALAVIADMRKLTL